MLGLLALGAGGATASWAADFTIVNKSLSTVYVAYTLRAPAKGLSKYGDPTYQTYGWYVIESGQTMVVYHGNEEHLFIRMTRDSSLDGAVLVPTSHQGEISYGVHPDRFRLDETVLDGDKRRYRLHYGNPPPGGNEDSYEHEARGNALEDVGCTVVSGFYRLRANTRFTVN